MHPNKFQRAVSTGVFPVSYTHLLKGPRMGLPTAFLYRGRPLTGDVYKRQTMTITVMKMVPPRLR